MKKAVIYFRRLLVIGLIFQQVQLWAINLTVTGGRVVGDYKYLEIFVDVDNVPLTSFQKAIQATN